ncbi:MAG TPA: hypothetical protein VFE06_00515 [Acidobacteriaceae bacterium]|nr:hypothetical protein [Acidobacteriaceae bacterium]
MIPALRRDFNAGFRPETFRSLLHGLDAFARTHVAFPIAETPCFFPRELLDEMASTGANLTRQLLANPVYLDRSLAAVPEPWRAANQTAHPHFLTADFGLVRESDGRLTPRLVEMQAFPSVFAFQWAVSEAYRSAFSLPPTLDYLFNGLTETSFWHLLDRTIVAGHDPETVVLIDVDPAQQKTLPDFHITADRLGIRIVDIAALEPIDPDPARPDRLPRLGYRNGSRLIPIRRIYNRAIVDELVRKQTHLQFDYREPFDVEWAGHPNWYFHISKFSLPWLDHPAVPPAVFLSDFLADPPNGPHRRRLPTERNRWILKPLYSFAGQGIQFAPSDEQLAAIPPARRCDFLLQERVSFEPVIDTPAGPTQAEIRILYVWPDHGRLTPLLSLVRLGRGPMMGVDHNRNQTWVGASAAFFPAAPSSPA